VTIGEIREVSPAIGRILFCSEAYCDGRLWRALAETTTTTLLIESAPPAAWLTLWEGLRRHSFGLSSGMALLEQAWLARMDPGAALLAELAESAAAARIGVIDAAREAAYVTGQRRNVRPVWFPAPEPAQDRLAESVLHDAIQNGVLDLPARAHAPIETWIVTRLCRTSIRPNQVTFVTMLFGLAVTLLLASGHLWPGTVLALAAGVLDGIDGKLARLKVETTELGKWEHALDYAIEWSWWTALAHYFSVHGLASWSWVLWLLLVGSDLIARIAKSAVKKTTGRNLDDVGRFDRRFRLVAGRRNIYIWIFGAGLFLGIPGIAFQLLCWWGVATAAIHAVRAWQIRASARSLP
jgi:phosphatidylglycerophosphate synthase